MYLFVYGTLKEGYHNNHYLADAELIREAETKPFYRLFTNGYFPMMIRSRREGYSVSGEIWRVDEDDIDLIDEHEAWYRREQIKVKRFKKRVWAYIYNRPLRAEVDQECYGQWP